jgi:hypothetical protein
MDERYDIILRPEDGRDPPSLLHDIKRAVDDLLSPMCDGAGKWLQGKGEAELAKAAEIKSKVYAAIAGLEHERQRLINERDAAADVRRNENERDRMAHEEKMYALKTERLTAIVASVTKLKELGVEIEVKVRKQIANKILSTIKDT